MKKILLIILTGILLFGCGQNEEEGIQDKLMYDKLLTKNNSEYYQMPLGLCEDWPEESTTRDIYVNDFKLLQRSGIKYLRISFGWDAIENEKDKYDWLFWDDFVKTGVEEYGITMVPYICYTPAWNSPEPVDSAYYWNNPPIDMEEFGEFMFDLVTRYKDYIKTWEIWNEPDISIYWRTQDVAQFAEFHKIGAKAVRKADPEAKIVLGGIAYRPEWIESLFKDHGVSEYTDIVNCHNYFETWHHNPVEEIADYINDVYNVVNEYGNGQPIWMAEVGYSTFKQGSMVSTSYTAYYNYEHTPEYQAVDLAKRVALVRSTGKIDAMAWYEIKDLPPSDEVIGDIYNNKHLGIAYADHSPKPANKALMFVNELLMAPAKSIGDKVVSDAIEGTDSRFVAFERENGDVLLFAWLQTVQYDKRSDDDTGEVKDERIETVSFTVPASLNGKATLYNELGEGAEFMTVEKSNSQTIVKDVTLEGGKIAVIEIKK
ncbi:MAG: hypothetical protein K9J16_03035 [Melioribacteraceae bacterium]|nr:hypothetical protein [Melioribacteraceae bacterium]MCF8355474.1 hypothetical protein [Melioribacteraceae bacterium]MCF8392549.1 hypothetical protein [Melioribacteraceae bacterium]MCF8418436.1 hypothetical protein [Melioribacteraceae bacterium]